MDLCQIVIRFGRHFSFLAKKLILSIWQLGINYIGSHYGQDIKPRFHSSRFHGSEDGEDDDVCGLIDQSFS